MLIKGQITRNNQRPNFDKRFQNPQHTFTTSNYGNNFNRGKNTNPNNRNGSTTNTNNSNKICNYCKKPGHIYENCFKRRNALQNNAAQNQRPVRNITANVETKDPQQIDFKVNSLTNETTLIYVITADEKSRFLIDTGAAVSIIKPKLVSHQTKTYNEQIALTGSTSSETVFATKSALFNIFGGKVHKFLIIDLENVDFEGIIGLDFLEKFKGSVDVGKMRLQFPDAEIPLYKTDNKKYQNVVKVPSRTLKTVKIVALNAVDDKFNYYICPFKRISDNLTAW